MADGSSPPAPPPPKHYCNVTFLSVGDTGPDGLPIERLLRCTRCQETYYCGKEQQKSHWKLHKKVCRPASDDIDATGFRDFQFRGVVAGILHIFDRSLPALIDESALGRALRFLLEKLQLLCSNSSEFGTIDGRLLHELCVRFSNLQMANHETIELIWAIPGMTTFLLNLDLISNTMRQRKLEGAAPTAEELKFQGYDPSFQNTCPYFVNAICYFLRSTIQKDQNRDPSIGYVAYRNNAVAAIAARKLMQWYADPYTRASIPFISFPSTQELSLEDKCWLSPRNYHFPSILEFLILSLINDPVDKTAVVPGLSIQDAVEIIILEPAWRFRIQRAGEDESPTCNTIRKLIRDASRVKPLSWESFSLTARAVTVHQIVGVFRGSPKVAHSIGTDLLNGVLGVSLDEDSRDEILWLKVVKLARTRKSADGIDFPYGRHTDFFAQWYTRSSGVAASLFHELFDILLEQCNGFSRYLLPPEPVLNHISEYAMEPFSDYPCNHFSD